MPKLNRAEWLGIRARLTRPIIWALFIAIAPVAFGQPKNVDDADPAGITTALMPPPTDVTNNPVLPPKWAFGVLFGCYENQSGALDTLQRLRKDYCGDLLWIDSSWLWGAHDQGGRYISFRFDENQFSDPKAMIAALHENHFHFGIWEWPYIDQSIVSLYQEGTTNHFFITDQRGGGGKVVNGGGWHGVKFTGQVDFTNPEAVNWWKQLNQPLLDLGVDFFKIDTYSTVPEGGVTFDGSGSENLRRLYHKTYFEMTQKAPGARGFILAHRIPSPDNDQYPGMWTGDTTASWAGFEDDLKRGAAMDTPQTAAFWTSDTGGYNHDAQNPDELYIRWLQYGTFLPITEFFSAKNTRGRFPWLFGEAAQHNFKFYTQLRYRLLPFRYSSAQMAYHETPVQYPVRFAPGTTDEIILGDGDSEMLVAPVRFPGARTRLIQLPAGAAWINYWTGETYDGGSSPTVAAPLDKVPVFVKAGSIIPMGPDMHYVDEKPADPLTLDIYPSRKSSYILYEDDGQSNDYQQGAYTRTPFACEIIGADAIIGIGAAQGNYRGKLRSRTYVLEIHRKAASLARISRNGAPLNRLGSKAALDSANQGWFNDAAAATVWVKFPTATAAASKVVLNGLEFNQ